jgi:hypothetical protein
VFDQACVIVVDMREDLRSTEAEAREGEEGRRALLRKGTLGVVLTRTQIITPFWSTSGVEL